MLTQLVLEAARYQVATLGQAQAAQACSRLLLAQGLGTTLQLWHKASGKLLEFAQSTHSVVYRAQAHLARLFLSSAIEEACVRLSLHLPFCTSCAANACMHAAHIMQQMHSLHP